MFKKLNENMAIRVVLYSLIFGCAIYIILCIKTTWAPFLGIGLLAFDILAVWEDFLKDVYRNESKNNNKDSEKNTDNK